MLILVCVATVFAADALGSNAADAFDTEFWLRLQWVGIIFLPVTYLHFSDALARDDRQTQPRPAPLGNPLQLFYFHPFPDQPAIFLLCRPGRSRIEDRRHIYNPPP